MLTMKSFATLVAATVVCLSSAQDTQPIQPHIKPTVVPPPVQLTAPTHKDMDASRPLGVEEAVKIALAHQTSVQIAKAQADAASGRTRQAQAAELPGLNLNAGYSKANPMTAATTSSSGYSAGATVSQLIYDFNVTRDSVRQAQALERAQLHVLTQAQADAVLSTKQAFYALAQNERLVTVAESNLKDREGQYALAKARFEGEIGAPQDVVLAQTNLDDAVLQLTQARSTALTSRVALAQSLGVDPLTPITLQDSSEPDQPSELSSLIKLALAQRPEVLAAKESLTASSFGISIARKSNVPSISLALGVNRQGPTGFSSTSQNTLGISVSWSLYDGGLAAGKVSEARANETASRKQLEQINQNVTTDVANVFVALKTADQSVTITSSQVANAQESVRLAEGRYKAGIATFLEVIDAEAALTQAKINQVNALTNVQIERAAMAHAVGANPLALR